MFDVEFPFPPPADPHVIKTIVDLGKPDERYGEGCATIAIADSRASNGNESHVEIRGGPGRIQIHERERIISGINRN
jgi:hypothetical protein